MNEQMGLFVERPAAPEPAPAQAVIDFSQPFASTPWPHWLRWVEQWAETEADPYLAEGSRRQRGHAVSVSVRVLHGLPIEGARVEDLRPTIEETLAVIRGTR